MINVKELKPTGSIAILSIISYVSSLALIPHAKLSVIEDPEALMEGLDPYVLSQPRSSTSFWIVMVVVPTTSHSPDPSSSIQ